MGFIGTLLCAIRFVSFVCMFIVGVGAAAYAKDIHKKLPQLEHPPYPPDLYRGHYLGAVFGIFGGVWSFLTFVPCGVFAGYSGSGDTALSTWVFLSFLVDTMIATGLSVAAMVQTGYLPSPVGSCSGVNELGPYPSGEPHWLDVLATIPRGENPQPTTRAGMCNGEALLWRVEIAMAVLSGIAALSEGLFVCFSTSFTGYLAKLIITICSPIIRIFPWLGKWIRYFNHRRHRSNKTKAILNSHKQQTQQAQISGGSFSTEKVPVSTTTNTPTTSIGSGGEGGEDVRWGIDIELGLNQSICIPSKNEEYLIRILGSYEMAQTIASSCHFTDFRSLMRVSKSVRIATIQSMKRDILKQTTCLDSDKSTCWSCGNQICSLCKTTHRLAKEVTFHIENCYPYCSACFRNKYCGRPIYEPEEEPQKYWTPVACRGHGSRLEPPDRVVDGVVSLRGRRMPERFTQYVYQDDSREVCELCATAWREARSSAQVEGKILKTSTGANAPKSCSGCSKELKPGKGDLVWWGCKMCGCECAEEFHQEIWDKGKRVENHG